MENTFTIRAQNATFFLNERIVKFWMIFYFGHKFSVKNKIKISYYTFSFPHLP